MGNAIAKIGQGIYTAADASRILKIPYPKANYWFKYYAKNKLFNSIGYRYYFEIKDVIAINFLTLIEMYVFYAWKEALYKTRILVEAHSAMAKYLKNPYPFATQDMYGHGGKLFFRDNFLLLTADKKLQSVMSDFLIPFSKKIAFNNDKLAHKFYPLGQDKTIIINPENQFGQPIIEGTNILTATIYKFYLGGESIDSISKIYDVTPQSVKDAIEFSQAA